MSNDIFADIGTRQIATRRGLLEEVQPQKLPNKFLPATQSDPLAAFTPAPKLDTAEKLAAELAQQRLKFEPFLKDHAPELPNLRITQQLEDFQWRLETEPDWTDIKVPHFGGPIGRAVAFYRTNFSVSQAMFNKGAVFVRFKGVDYKAHVFINDQYVGSHEGFFAPFEFECSACLHEGENTLLVKVENDAVYLGNNAWGQKEEGDKLYAATNLGWDDPELGWGHCPPGFGIYQEVFIEARAPLHLSDIFVRPLPDEQRAEAWIEVWNKDRQSLPVAVEVSVYGQNFSQTVIHRLHHTPGTRIIPGVGDLQKPTDNQDVLLTMGPGANLIKLSLPIPQPRLWDLETPWLYQIQVTLLNAEGNALDTAKRQFGLRSFQQDNDNEPKGKMFLNHREIKLRGANTMGFEQQDVFKKDFQQLIDDILLAKICNMNFLRLTQRPVQSEVYEYCDRLGLMTQSDLPLFGCMRYNKFAEGVRQVEEMERIVRSHVCNVMISYINEPFPNASGRPHRHLTRPEMQAFFEACDRVVRVLNPDQCIKHVDGDYDPPSTTLPDNHCYCGWYNGHGMELGKLHRGYWMPVNRGWQYACGEFGSEGLDFADLMRRRYPQKWLPGADESTWSPEFIRGSQTGNFHYMWFDTEQTLDGWVHASQHHQEWATRMFAERFRRDNQMVSFAIHLFIDAFPSSWMKTIMDCERRPKPAFFAYRDALEPLTVSIRTDRWKFYSGEAMPFEFWICNDTAEAGQTKMLRYQLEQNGQVLFTQKTVATVEAMRATFQGYFSPMAPSVERRTKYTLRLALGETHTAIDFEVFPAASEIQEVSVGSIGSGGLLRELGIQPAQGKASVIFVDDFSQYLRDPGPIDRAAEAGARVVFLGVPLGEHEIGGSTVRVMDCVMRPREFVSRATGHPLVEGFESEDFKCWFDPKADYFKPLLPTMFEADGWRPIPTNGNGVWGGQTWKKMLAVAEKPMGKGSFIICQVELEGRTKHNPTAAMFARRLATTTVTLK